MKIRQFRKKIITGPFELWKRYRNPLFWITIARYTQYIEAYRWRRGIIYFKKPKQGNEDEARIPSIVYTWLTTGTEADGGMFDEEELRTAPDNVYGCEITLTSTVDGYTAIIIDNKEECWESGHVASFF